MITLLTSIALAAEPHNCSLYHMGQGNAVLDDTLGFHREQCFGTGVPGEVRLNNRDAYVAGGQNKEAGEFQARNSAYVVLNGRTPLRQWARYPADGLPDVALAVLTDNGGTPDYPFDDVSFVNVGTVVNAPADILARVGARKVTTRSGVEVMAAPAIRPGSVDKISTGKSGATDLVLVKFVRQGDSEVFEYAWAMSITVPSGFEVPLTVLNP